MSAKKLAPKVLVIKGVRLINGTSFGREAIIHQHLLVNGRDTTRVDNQPVVISFDLDQRFIRVDHAEGRFTLVPLTNVGSVMCEMADAE